MRYFIPYKLFFKDEDDIMMGLHGPEYVVERDPYVDGVLDTLPLSLLEGLGIVKKTPTRLHLQAIPADWLEGEPEEPKIKTFVFHELAQMEGTEVGEYWARLDDLYSFSSEMSYDFRKALYDEIKEVFDFIQEDWVYVEHPGGHSSLEYLPEYDTDGRGIIYRIEVEDYP